MNIFEEQKDLEDEMILTGVHKFQKQTREAKEKGHESTSYHGILLMKKLVVPLSRAIDIFIREDVDKPGRGKITVPLLAMLESDVIAFISLRCLMDGISAGQKLVAVSHSVGQALSDQVRFNIWRTTDRKYFKGLVDKIGKTSASRHYRRYGLIRRASTNIGDEVPVWTSVERTQVGQCVIDLIIKSTGLVKLGSVKAVGKKYSSYSLVPTQVTLDFIQETIEKGQMLSPSYLPMVVAPKRWTDIRNGGYLSHRVPFLKTSFKNHGNLISYHRMEMEYKTTNSLQETQWVVNKQVLEQMSMAWTEGQLIGDIPDRKELPVPPSPVPKNLKKSEFSESQKELFKAWKGKATIVYHENIRRKSRILQFMRTLQIAERFKKYEQLYFPYQADFRGRKYTIPAFLTPQGTEPAKALLTFAKGLPIEDQEQADWLAIHGANCAGVDKVSFEERIQWISENEHHIIQSAEQGLDYTWWTKFDDAWLFFAFCLEWAGYKRKGFGYISHLPIALDGSNNGLQHYSAMLRCSVGGKATNLTNEEHPQDTYQQVADVVKRELERLCEDCTIARFWNKSGIVNRKMTKRPVMVVPYGGTRFSCLNYVEEYVDDQIRAGISLNFPEHKKHEYINFLTNLVWAAISEVVISARECMNWIRDVAKRLSKVGKPLMWATPTGLYVYQHYKAFKWRQIDTTIDGKLLRPVLLEEDGLKIDPQRSINGSAPNFVHSLDASCLTLTLHKCINENIDAFAMIHDSYGTHANKTPQLAKLLREAFVEIYTDNDVLTQFRSSALEVLDEVPEPPKRGTLDLNQVLDSKYFFC
jgi:DNA-directed RNA polymerase